MNASLFEGDYVIINKLAYGPRLPITPLSLNISGTKKYLKWLQLPYMRLPGITGVHVNDVVAFNYALAQDEPIDMQEGFIKRCLGLPGDSFKISNGDVWVNNRLIVNAQEYNLYHMTSDVITDSVALARFGIIANKISTDGKVCDAMLTRHKADSLSAIKNTSVAKDVFAKNDYHPSVYPNHPDFKWNYDHFGPLWIPKQGDSIALNRYNLLLYQRCIEVYEKTPLQFKGDTVFINGARAAYYTFKQNYYFMLGDNRHNSVDSRVIGLIPGDHIIGKASFILWSKHTAKKLVPLH